MFFVHCHAVVSRRLSSQIAKEHDVKRFMFSSSATVYGTPQYLPIDENHPVGVGITNPYGRTKYMVEEILHDVQRSDKVIDVCFPKRNVWILSQT